jgi:hypothetical protein
MKPSKPIDATVTAKLQAQRGQGEALALWRELWAAYEREGVEGAEAWLARLLELPGEGPQARREEGP